MAFHEIFGHRRTLGLLSKAIDSGALPPSLIFAGPPGVGKLRTAFAVAQTLNCPTPLRNVPCASTEAAPDRLPVDACGRCATCRRIARRVHPDVLALEPEPEKATIGIEQIRRLTEQVGYRPYEARRRVVIVDDAADVLLPIPQNALLKSLEEPPSATAFILVTAHPDALLPTVRSRCPLVRFAPLTVRDVAAYLRETPGLTEADAAARAAMSGGSIAAALDSGGLVEARDRVFRVLTDIVRSRDARMRLDAAGHIATGTGKRAGAGEREALAEHLRVMHALLRDVGVLGTGADRRAIANADVVPALEPLVPVFGRERLVDAFTAIDRGLAALERNASPKIVADWVVLQL